MRKKDNRRIEEYREIERRAKRTAHKAMKTQRQFEEEQHIEAVKAKRASMRKYYRDHPEARHKNREK